MVSDCPSSGSVCYGPECPQISVHTVQNGHCGTGILPDGPPGEAPIKLVFGVGNRHQRVFFGASQKLKNPPAESVRHLSSSQKNRSSSGNDRCRWFPCCRICRNRAGLHGTATNRANQHLPAIAAGLPDAKTRRELVDRMQP